MNSSEFIKRLIDAATNHKTLYVMGCFGAPMTEANKARYIKHHSYNSRPIPKAAIQNASKDTFGFDCVCLVKGILWGWDADLNDIYGGAEYASNGVPDIGTEGMIKVCKDVSTNFANIIPGELVWLEGHVGVYIGDKKVVECTPAWQNKVQITGLSNLGGVKGLNNRSWTKHGKIPYITYDSKPTPVPETNPYTVLPLLRKGSVGDLVKLVQIKVGTDPDGDFGNNTYKAVCDFQTKNKLEVDGIVGKDTYKALFG